KKRFDNKPESPHYTHYLSLPFPRHIKILAGCALRGMPKYPNGCLRKQILSPFSLVRTALSVIGLIAAAVAAVLGQSAPTDWPQWRGPDRSGVSRESGLLKQ